MRAINTAIAALLVAFATAGCGVQLLDTPPTREVEVAVAPTMPPVGPPADREAGAAPTATAAPTISPAPTTEQLRAEAPAAASENADTQTTAPEAAALAPLSAVAVVEDVWPAVVTVVSDIAVDPFSGEVQEQGRGTGFIIDDQGHIVTNQHVVAGSDSFEVIFSDGSKRPAELIGSDEMSDLAVVRVDGGVPGMVSFGDSDQLRVGQPVLAIGSPLGEFSGTVTDGIVSALNRDFPGDTGVAEYNNLIQHNAAINPGNSGGPLFDLTGHVIGVNTLGIPLSPDGSPVQGIFFAIPANSVQMVAAQLIENGRVSYPYFGATPGDIYPELAAQYDLPVEFGTYLVSVTANDPAGRAGLREGDIVTALNGEPITAQEGFSEVLFQFRPGDTITVSYIRDGREMEANVTLAEREN